jgi:oligopeptide transport system substrate-binding protein
MQKALDRSRREAKDGLPEVQSSSRGPTPGHGAVLWGPPSSGALRRFILCLLLVIALVPSACDRRDEAERSPQHPSQTVQKTPSGGTYRRPLGNDPTTLDPPRITDLYAVAVANQVFDSLVEFDVHLNVLPALAQSWSASRDGLVWSFNLRQGVKFHHGREMIAADVVYSLARLLDPAVGSPRFWLLDKVKGAAEFREGKTKTLEGMKAVDRYTVQITLSEPFAPFISVLGLPHVGIVPREEVERLGVDFGHAPVGTGPFRFVRWERGQEIILEVNEHYFRKPPTLDRIRFIIFPGNPANDMLAAFERGELEESPIPSDRRQELLEDPRYRVFRKPTLSLMLLGFNLARPPFDRREVRQAFNYAIDKVHLNQEIRENRFIVAKGILPPGMPGYNPEIQDYSYDPEKAKVLLGQAGFPGGTGFPITTLWQGSKSAVARQDYQAIQQYLGRIGVQVDLKELDDWPTFRQSLQQGKPEIFRYAWFADYPDPDNFLYPLFHSKSQTNYFRYHNAVVDRLLDDARRETGDLRRVKLYREAEQLILQDAPGVMLLHFTYEGLFKPYVEGVEVNALGDPYIPMWKIRLKPHSQANAKK